MRDRSPFPWQPGLALLLIATAAAAQAPDPRIARVFQLFEVWKLPALADKPFVRVLTGRQQWNRNRFYNSTTHGFLLADERKRFRILTPDLRTEWFYRTPRGAPAHITVGYIGESLKVRARQLQIELKRIEDNTDKVRRSLGTPPIHHTPLLEALVVGWQCAVRDMKQSVHGLSAAILAVEKAPYRRIHEELRYNQLWHVIAELGDSRVAWSEHLVRLGTFAERFPKGKHAAWVGDAIQTLRRMIAEDRRRRSKPADTGIAALIYGLRTQHGREVDTLGSCDIFRDARGARSPAHRLRALGLTAVPALLAALDDDSFTRSVGITVQSKLDHCALRVADCARTILEQRAHRTFGRVDKPRQTRREAEFWWREVRTKGETQALVDAVARGDAHAYSQAQYLIEKSPDLARVALRLGVASANQTEVKKQLIKLLNTLR